MIATGARRRRGERRLFGRRRENQGHAAEALEEGAQAAAGKSVGDAVFEQRLEEVEDVDGDFAAGHLLNFVAELEPAGAAVPCVLQFRAAGFAGRSVMAAESVAGGGHAAALAAIGQGEDTFGGHGTSGDR
jgi:hypothetical protein